MRSVTTRTILRHAVAYPELGRGCELPRTTLSVAISHSSSSRLSTLCRPKLLPGVLPPSALRYIHDTPRVNKSREPDRPGKDAKSAKGEKHKKRPGKVAPARAEEADTESSSRPKHPAPDPEEPLAFADVRSRLAGHAEHFRTGLKQLRSGGRFTEDAIGHLRVQTDRKSPQTFPLRELAQVIPRGGRTISLLVHEEDYIKPVMSAVQASPEFNQQPQRAPDNELELLLKVEPERPEDVLKKAKAACNDWRDRVRDVRRKREQQHTTWKKEGVLGPDAKKTADKELEKVIKAEMTTIDTEEKQALKGVGAK
ncbi:ribosome recycling factor [Xylariaceae sp. FL0016]|nr:ribosome recycling factor [Xylariaceae sp. FL0016]